MRRVLGVVVLFSACTGSVGLMGDGGVATTDAGLIAPLDAGPPLTPGDAGAADVHFEVRSDLPTHAISPLIYGTNQPSNPEGSRYGLIRHGGNRLSAFNWENNASNAGVDYRFQNDGYLVQDLPAAQRNTPGAAITAELTLAQRIDAALLVTVPIGLSVAADKNGDGDVRNSGPNYLSTRFKQNRSSKGSALSTTPDVNDAFVNQDEFINWLKGNTGGTPVIVSLDNEPDLWSDSHPEIHPAKVTYVELTTRSIEFAKAIKSTWPGVPVTGFVSYGWAGYVNLQSASDANGKGEFIDYFLAQMKTASEAEGHRLVDYLDLHWYPEAKGNGRIIGTDTSAASITARVQAPRSLWDATYRETSWIEDTLNAPINLIPRVKAKIDAKYPGTKLAFTEWNYGGGAHISGAIAVADVLGIFGRDGVDLATYWKLNGAEPYAEAAFQAFRNFDGAHAAFGDTSISASTDDPEHTSFYASADVADPSRVVLVALNKTNSSTSASLTLTHGTSFTTLKTWRVTASGSSLSAGPDVAATAQNAFRIELPAMSITVIEPRR